MWWDFVNRSFDDDDIKAINEVIDYYGFSSLNISYKNINKSVINLVKVFRLIYDYGDNILYAPVSRKIRRQVRCILFDNGYIKAEDMENSVIDLPLYVWHDDEKCFREVSKFNETLEKEFYRYCVKNFIK